MRLARCGVAPNYLEVFLWQRLTEGATKQRAFLKKTEMRHGALRFLKSLV